MKKRYRVRSRSTTILSLSVIVIAIFSVFVFGNSVPVQLNKDTFLMGETVSLSFPDLRSLDSTELMISSDKEEFRFLGIVEDRIKFIPREPGLYLVQLYKKGTDELLYETSFAVNERLVRIITDRPMYDLGEEVQLRSSDGGSYRVRLSIGKDSIVLGPGPNLRITPKKTGTYLAELLDGDDVLSSLNFFVGSRQKDDFLVDVKTKSITQWPARINQRVAWCEEISAFCLGACDASQISLKLPGSSENLVITDDHGIVVHDDAIYINDERLTDIKRSRIFRHASLDLPMEAEKTVRFTYDLTDNRDLSICYDTAAPSLVIQPDGDDYIVWIDSDMAYSDLRLDVEIAPVLKSQLKIYWMIDGLEYDITNRDDYNVTFSVNNDGRVGNLSWNVPYAQNKTFRIGVGAPVNVNSLSGERLFPKIDKVGTGARLIHQMISQINAPIDIKLVLENISMRKGPAEIEVVDPQGFRYLLLAEETADGFAALFYPTQEGSHSVEATYEDGLNTYLIRSEFNVTAEASAAPDIIAPLDPKKIIKASHLNVPSELKRLAFLGHFSVKDQKGNAIGMDLSGVDDMTGDAEIVIDGLPVKKMVFRNLSDKTASLRIGSLEDDKRWTQGYAIDPEDLEFDSAVVTAVAKGTELYKCKEWDFLSEICMGSWDFMMDITPGEEYSFVLTRDDPGFGESVGWWNTSWEYRRGVYLNNSFNQMVPANYTFNISLDTATLISQSKMKSDCSDLRVVWWDGSANVPIEWYNSSSCDGSATRILFRCPRKIKPNSAYDNITLYYGNPDAPTPTKNLSQIYLFYDDFESYAVGSTGSPRWQIYQQPGEWKVVSLSGNKVYKGNPGVGDYGSSYINGIIFNNITMRMRMYVNLTLSGTPPRDDFIGIFARSQSMSSEWGSTGYLIFKRLQTTSDVSIFENGGTQWTASSSVLKYQQWINFYLRMYGGNFVYRLDGTTYHNVTDASPTRSGYLALHPGRVDAFYDDIKIQQTVPTEPGFYLASEEINDDPPVIELLSPSGNLVDNNVSFTYVVTDDNGVVNCSLFGDFSGSFLRNMTNTSIDNGFINWFNLSLLPDGDYGWNVECTDNQNQSSMASANNTFHLDTSLVGVIINLPTNTFYGSIERLLDVTFSESYDSWWFDADGTNITVCSGGSCPLHDSTLFNATEGVNTVIVYVNDSIPQLNFNQRSFTVDTTEPSVSLSYPDGHYLTSTVNVRYVPSDSSPFKNCSLYTNITGAWTINQTNSSITSSTTNNFYIFNVPEGRYAYNVRCSDIVGNSNLSYMNKTFIVDMTSPVIAVDWNQADGSLDNDYELTDFFNWSASDASGIQSVDWRIWKNGGSLWATDWSSDIGTSGTGYDVTTSDADVTDSTQSYILYVRATDNTGNKVNQSITFKIDRTAPILNITIDESSLYGASVDISGNCSDSVSGIDSSSIEISYDTNSTMNITWGEFSVVDSPGLDWSDTHIFQKTGNYAIRARVSDIAGNTYEGSIGVIEDFSVDIGDIIAVGQWVEGGISSAWRTGQHSGTNYHYTHDGIVRSGQELALNVTTLGSSDGWMRREGLAISNDNDIFSAWVYPVSSCEIFGMEISDGTSQLVLKFGGTQSGFGETKNLATSLVIGAWNHIMLDLDHEWATYGLGARGDTDGISIIADCESTPAGKVEAYLDDIFVYSIDSSRQIDVEADKPSISLVIEPASGDYGVDSFDINWTVTDTNYDHSYANVTDPIGGLLFTLTENTSLTPENISLAGIYSITAYAEDTIGNSNVTFLTFTIFNYQPSISLMIEPLSGYYGVDSFDLNWTITDVNLDSTYANISYPNGSLMYTLLENTTLTSENLSVAGIYSVVVYANDTLGLDNITSSTFTVTDQPPSITLLSPMNNSGDIDGDVIFSFRVDDFTGIRNCSLAVDRTVVRTNDSVSVGAQMNMSMASLGLGRHNWSIGCYDLADLMNTSAQRTLSVIKAISFGGDLTDLSTVDMQNIPNFFIRRVGYGMINFTAAIDLSEGLNLDGALTIIANAVSLDSISAPALNHSADITLYGLGFIEWPLVEKDGTLCLPPACNLLDYSAGTLLFNVSGFSNYSASDNSELVIFDANGPMGGDTNRTTGKQLKFFANYTNRISGNPVEGAGDWCNISFNPGVTLSMPYNSTSEMYEYNRSFMLSGNYSYNVSCDGTSSGHEPLNGTDYAEVPDNQLYIDVSTSAPAFEQGEAGTITTSIETSLGRPIGATVYSDAIFINETNIFGSGYLVRWWDPSWGIREPYLITENGFDDLSEFQINVTLDTAAAIADGRMRSDCADIRVVNSTNDEIPFYLEDSLSVGCGSERAILWVQVPSVPSGSTEMIYVYYNNSAASTPASDKMETFNYSVLTPTQYIVSQRMDTIGNLDVVSMVDGNTVSILTDFDLLNNASTASYGNVQYAQNASVWSYGPFMGVGDGTVTDALTPISYASDTFIYSIGRYEDEWHVFAPYCDATVSVYDGNNGAFALSGTSFSVTKGQTTTVTRDIAGTGNVVDAPNAVWVDATCPVLVVHDNTNPGDSFVMHPPANDWWGVPGTRMDIGALYDNTNVTYYRSDGTSSSTILNAGQDDHWSGLGNTGNEDAFHIVSDKPVGVTQIADGDGGESVTFLPEYELDTRYYIPNYYQYIAIATTQPNTRCWRYDASHTQIGLAVDSTGSGDPYPFPGKVYFGSRNANGDYVVCNNTFYAYYEPTNNDESNLWGVKAIRKHAYPGPTITSYHKETLVVSDIQTTPTGSASYDFDSTGQPFGWYYAYSLAQKSDYIDDSDYTVFNVTGSGMPQVFGIEIYPDPNSIGSYTYFNATIVDNIGIDTAIAMVTFPNGTHMNVTMSWSGTGSTYSGNFNNITVRGTYNVTIFANDTTGNINDTEKLSFSVTYASLALDTDKDDYVEGETVHIFGGGFDAYTNVTLIVFNPSMDPANGTVFPAIVMSNSTGGINLSWTIHPGPDLGMYLMNATEDINSSRSIEGIFNVISAIIQTDSSSYTQGDTVIITGLQWDYPGNVSYNITDPYGVLLAGYPVLLEVNSTGGINDTFFVDYNATTGNYGINATQPENPGKSDGAVFTVIAKEADTWVDHPWYKEGETVGLEGYGFSPLENISVDVKDSDDVSIAGYPLYVLSNSTGGFNKSIYLSGISYDNYTILSIDSSYPNLNDTESFEFVKEIIMADSRNYNDGDTVYIIGRFFDRGATVIVNITNSTGQVVFSESHITNSTGGINTTTIADVGNDNITNYDIIAYLRSDPTKNSSTNYTVTLQATLSTDLLVYGNYDLINITGTRFTAGKYVRLYIEDMTRGGYAYDYPKSVLADGSGNIVNNYNSTNDCAGDYLVTAIDLTRPDVLFANTTYSISQSGHPAFDNSDFEEGSFTPGWTWRYNRIQSGQACSSDYEGCGTGDPCYGDAVLLTDSDNGFLIENGGQWSSGNPIPVGGGGTPEANILNEAAGGSTDDKYNGMQITDPFYPPTDTVNLTFFIYGLYVSAENGCAGNRYDGTLNSTTANTLQEGLFWGVWLDHDNDTVTSTDSNIADDELIWELYTTSIAITPAYTGTCFNDDILGDTSDDPRCDPQNISIDITKYVGRRIYLTAEITGNGAADSGLIQLDDIGFDRSLVACRIFDIIPPTVVQVDATPDTSARFTPVMISANVTDATNVSRVIAMVTRPDSTQANLTLVSFGTGGIYNASFTGTSSIGQYDILIFANDTQGNINQTETGAFTIFRENVTLYTDRSDYIVNDTVFIFGEGYSEYKNVTVTVFNSTGDIVNITAFPRKVVSNATGGMNDSWHIPVDQSLGVYTVNATDNTNSSYSKETTFEIVSAIIETQQYAGSGDDVYIQGSRMYIIGRSWTANDNVTLNITDPYGSIIYGQVVLVANETGNVNATYFIDYNGTLGNCTISAFDVETPGKQDDFVFIVMARPVAVTTDYSWYKNGDDIFVVGTGFSINNSVNGVNLTIYDNDTGIPLGGYPINMGSNASGAVNHTHTVTGLLPGNYSVNVTDQDYPSLSNVTTFQIVNVSAAIDSSSYSTGDTIHITGTYWDRSTLVNITVRNSTGHVVSTDSTNSNPGGILSYDIQAPFPGGTVEQFEMQIFKDGDSYDEINLTFTVSLKATLQTEHKYYSNDMLVNINGSYYTAFGDVTLNLTSQQQQKNALGYPKTISADGSGNILDDIFNTTDYCNGTYMIDTSDQTLPGLLFSNVSFEIMPWWNKSYPYRQGFYVYENSGDDLYEYVVNITIDTAALIASGHMEPDCRDMRFIDSDLDALSYFIENSTGKGCDQTDTMIWVQIESMPADSEEYVLMYYGNDTVPAMSEETLTFTYSEPRTVGYVVTDLMASTALSVISLANDNTITDGSISRDLAFQGISTLSSVSLGTAISAKALFQADTAVDATDTISPASWASREFYYQSNRDTNFFALLSPFGTANVTVYDGGISPTNILVDDTGTILAKDITNANAVRVSSDIPIYVQGYSQSAGTPNGDSFLFYHPTTEYLYGVPSAAMTYGNGPSGGNVHWINNTGHSGSDLTLGSNDAGSRTNLGSDGAGGAYRIYGDGPIGVTQLADSDGRESTTFLPQVELGRLFGSSIATQYVVVAAPFPDTTCDIYDNGGSLDNSLTGGSRSDVNRIGFDTGNDNAYLSGGWYMECDKPVYAYTEKSFTDNDETQLWTWKQMRQYVYPEPTLEYVGEEVYFECMEFDNTPPSVLDLMPLDGTSFNLSAIINISINVSDDVSVGDVYAEVTYNNGTRLNLTMTDTDADGIFNATFYDTSSLLGRFDFTIYANDTWGNINDTESGYFNINDTIAPNWTANSSAPPSPLIYVPGTVSYFNMTWSDNFLLDTVWIEHDFSGAWANHTINSSTDVYEYNYTGIVPGTYFWRMHANDSSGNKNQTDLYVYEVVGGSTIVNLTFNGTDDNITVEVWGWVNMTGMVITPASGYIKLFMDGVMIDNGTGSIENLAQMDVVGIFNITLNFPDDGNYSGVNESHLIEVVDNRTPGVSEIFPSGGSKHATGKPINVSAIVTDNYQIDKVLVNVSWEGNTRIITLKNRTKVIFNGSFTNVSDPGRYNLTILANDTSGNINSTEHAQFILLDQPYVFVDKENYVEGETVYGNGTGFDLEVNVSAWIFNSTDGIVTGFPANYTSDHFGRINFTWLVQPGQALGTYTLNMTDTTDFSRSNITTFEIVNSVIEADKEVVVQGDWINISGYNWDAPGNVSYNITGPGGSLLFVPINLTVNTTGHINTSYQINYGAALGTYIISGEQLENPSKIDTFTFTVVKRNVSVSVQYPWYKDGEDISVNITGYGVSDDNSGNVTIVVYNNDTGVPVAGYQKNISSNATGWFNDSFIVSGLSDGNYTINISDNLYPNLNASAAFEIVSAYIMTDSDEYVNGDMVYITGRYWDRFQNVTIDVINITGESQPGFPLSQVADINGSISASLVAVPIGLTSALYNVTATDTDDPHENMTVNYAVIPQAILNLNDTTPDEFESVNISGSYFTPGGDVWIQIGYKDGSGKVPFYPKILAADAFGDVSDIFEAGELCEAEYVVELVDMTSPGSLRVNQTFNATHDIINNSMELADAYGLTGLANWNSTTFSNTFSTADSLYQYAGGKDVSANAFMNYTFILSGSSVQQDNITKITIMLDYCHSGNQVSPICGTLANPHEGTVDGPQLIQIWNFTAGVWQDIGSIKVYPTNDRESRIKINLTGGFSDFLYQDTIRARFEVDINVTGFNDAFLVIDYVSVNISYEQGIDRPCDVYDNTYLEVDVFDSSMALRTDAIVTIRNSTGQIIDDTSFDDVDGTAIGSFFKYLSPSVFDPDTYDVMMMTDVPGGPIVSTVGGLDLSTSRNLTVQVIDSYPYPLPGTVQNITPIFTLDDSYLSFGNAVVAIPNITAMDVVLHCLSWNYGSAQCLNWQVNDSSDYNATYNGTHTIFNVTSFDSFGGGKGFTLPNVTAISVYDVTGQADTHVGGTLVASGLNMTFGLNSSRTYRVVFYVENDGDRHWVFASDDVMYHLGLNDSWQVDTTDDIYYNLSGGYSNAGGTFVDGQLNWTLAASDRITKGASGNFTYIVNVTSAGGTGEPDLSISKDNIHLSNPVPVEGENITINATIGNLIGGTGEPLVDGVYLYVEDVSDASGSFDSSTFNTSVPGGSDAENITVQFFDGNYSNGTQIGNNQTFNISADGSVVVNMTWLAKIGTHFIEVLADPVIHLNGTINESDETNNNATVNLAVSSYHTYYGSVKGNVSLANSDSHEVFQWTSLNLSGNIYAADADSSVNWEYLQALGRDFMDLPVYDDFWELDVDFNMSFFNDSINKTWTVGGSPRNLSNITVFGNTIYDVSIVNSTAYTFTTGILWDRSDGGGEFDTNQDVVFVSEMVENAVGGFGTYDYEIKVPSRLEKYMGVTDQVNFYVEIK